MNHDLFFYIQNDSLLPQSVYKHTMLGLGILASRFTSTLLSLSLHILRLFLCGEMKQKYVLHSFHLVWHGKLQSHQLTETIRQYEFFSFKLVLKTPKDHFVSCSYDLPALNENTYSMLKSFCMAHTN